MLPWLSQTLLLCGCLLLASTAGSADSNPASKGAGNATVAAAGSTLSASKAGVDEAALAAQRRASEAAALSNVELSGQTKAGVNEAAVAAQLRAAQAAALLNVELSGQTKAGVDEAAVAAQLRAAEAVALSNVEMRSQTKAAADEAGLAAAQRAKEAAAAPAGAQPLTVADVAPGVVRVRLRVRLQRSSQTGRHHCDRSIPWRLPRALPRSIHRGRLSQLS